MTFLLVLHAFITLALIGIILMQKGEGGGVLGSGGGNANSAFTARGAANLLTRITAVLAGVFMINCLVMSVIARKEMNRHSLIANIVDETNTTDKKEIKEDIKPQEDDKADS
jgi:preprotein translocase subunit SecG